MASSSQAGCGQFITLVACGECPVGKLSYLVCLEPGPDVPDGYLFLHQQVTDIDACSQVPLSRVAMYDN